MILLPQIEYCTEKGNPNHVVVIKYVPSVDDSSAMDEYVGNIYERPEHNINA